MAARALLRNYDYINVQGNELLKQLEINNFRDRRIYYLILLTFKNIHGLAPHYSFNNILFLYEATGKYLRSFDSMNLYKPKVNKNIFKTSLSYSGVDLWNKLPMDIMELTNLYSFKTKLKKVIMTF